MRKINALMILINLGAWAVTTNSRVAASTPVGIDPLQMMTGATNLPPSNYRRRRLDLQLKRGGDKPALCRTIN